MYPGTRNEVKSSTARFARPRDAGVTGRNDHRQVKRSFCLTIGGDCSDLTRPLLFPPMHHHSVLLVEDNEDVRAAIAMLLRVEGTGVVEASDGAEALDQLHKGPPPCVILLDLMMPNTDGWQFRKAQIHDPLIAKIPVVLLSGAGNLPHHADELGACGYLKKPIDVDELVHTVWRFCDHAEPQLAI